MDKFVNLNIDPNQKIYFNYPKHVSVFFLFNNKNQVLMQLRDDKLDIACPNIWGPVGGHCHLYETPTECVKREVLEETGYEIKNKLNWFSSFELPYNNQNNLKQFVSVFWSIYDNEQKINCYEGQKIKFLDISKIVSYEMLRINIDWIYSIKNLYIK